MYDSAGRVEKTYQVTGLAIDFSGPNPNSLQSVLKASGTTLPNTTSSSVYDSVGRVVQSVDGYGRFSTTTYNTKGNVTETRSQTYDALNQLKVLVSRTAYDQFGRGVLSTESYIEGATTPFYGTQSLFDSSGLSIGSVRRVGVVISLTGAESSITSVGTFVSESSTEYDSQGRAYKQIGADGQISIAEYDSRGRVVASLGMHVLATSVGLSAIGLLNYVRMRSETVFNSLGQAYQSATNIIEYGTVTNGVFTKTSTDVTHKRVTQQVYDEQNRVVKVIYPDGTFTRTEFDAQGRVVAEIDPLGNRKDLSYNASGQLAQVQLPAVPTVANPNVTARPTYQYEYNSFGHLPVLDLNGRGILDLGGWMVALKRGC